MDLVSALSHVVHEAVWILYKAFHGKSGPFFLYVLIITDSGRSEVLVDDLSSLSVTWAIRHKA